MFDGGTPRSQDFEALGGIAETIGETSPGDS